MNINKCSTPMMVLAVLSFSQSSAISSKPKRNLIELLLISMSDFLKGRGLFKLQEPTLDPHDHQVYPGLHQRNVTKGRL